MHVQREAGIALQALDKTLGRVVVARRWQLRTVAGFWSMPGTRKGASENQDRSRFLLEAAILAPCPETALIRGDLPLQGPGLGLDEFIDTLASAYPFFEAPSATRAADCYITSSSECSCEVRWGATIAS